MAHKVVSCVILPLLTLASFPRFGLAESDVRPVISLTLVRVEGAYAITEDQALEVYQESAKIIGPAARVKLIKFISVKEYLPKKSIALARYKNTLERTKLKRVRWVARRKNSLLHVLRPPVQEGGKLWINGAAVICSPKGVSYSSATEFNASGEARLQHSAAAMAHEILHALGAHHLVGDNIMNADALHLPEPWNLTVHPITRNEVRNCAHNLTNRSKLP